MEIAIIGSGNVGSTLALAFKKAGHTVVLGVRNKDHDFKGKLFAIEHQIDWQNTAEAVAQSRVVVLCTQGNLAVETAKSLGNVSEKLIIDTMNSVMNKSSYQHGAYKNTTEAVLQNCNCSNVVKCFNTTGFENMANPVIDRQAIDMFVAGSSISAKKAAMQLANDIGFGKVWDFGGDDKISLLEELAMCWINLAIIQKNGRRMGIRFVQ